MSYLQVEKRIHAWDLGQMQTSAPCSQCTASLFSGLHLWFPLGDKNIIVYVREC